MPDRDTHNNRIPKIANRDIGNLTPPSRYEINKALVSIGATVLPDSQNWLDLMARPALMEAFTLEDLIKNFELSGYRNKGVGTVSIGWGQKLGDDYKSNPTSAMIKTQDDKLVLVSIGTSCLYSYEVYSENTKKPLSPDEIKTISRLEKIFGETMIVSDKARKFIDS